MLNDPRYTQAKTHINRKRLSYKFWYWTKTAITFGEECRSIDIKDGAILQFKKQTLLTKVMKYKAKTTLIFQFLLDVFHKLDNDITIYIG